MVLDIVFLWRGPLLARADFRHEFILRRRKPGVAAAHVFDGGGEGRRIAEAAQQLERPSIKDRVDLFECCHRYLFPLCPSMINTLPHRSCLFWSTLKIEGIRSITKRLICIDSGKFSRTFLNSLLSSQN